jgi:hypothetical protein
LTFTLYGINRLSKLNSSFTVANDPNGAWICHKMDHHYMDDIEYNECIFSKKK